MSVPTNLETNQGKKRIRMEPVERREQVLEVASGVFAEKGYRASSVTDIVERAGIGRGTFYLYFQSKQDVFLEVIEKYFSDFARLLAENRTRMHKSIEEGDETFSVWRDNTLRILEYHRDNPDITSVVYRGAAGNDVDFAERVAELSQIGRKQLSEEFRLMQKHGLMRECDVEFVTTIILGSAINVIMEHVVGVEGADLERLADQFIDYHVRALIAQGAV